MKIRKVIIEGGGLSVLSAAYELWLPLIVVLIWADPYEKAYPVQLTKERVLEKKY